jgi:alpha-ribazole phosphatase CobZ
MNQTDMNTPNNSIIHFNPNSLIIHREECFLTLGDCEIGGGFNKVQNIIAHYPNDLSEDPVSFLNSVKSFMDENNIKGSVSAIKTHQVLERSVSLSQGKVSTITIPQKVFLLEKVSENLKTINCTPNAPLGLTDNIIIVNHYLDEKSLIKCFKIAIEAKNQALDGLGVSSSPQEYGEYADESIIVAGLYPAESSEKNKEILDESSLAEILQNIEFVVSKGIQRSLQKSGFSLGILDYVHQEGISIEDLVEAGIALCVGVDVTSELKTKLRNQILKSLEDINVMALIMAGIRVEEDFSGHHLREVDVDDDPAYLYTDEVLGMAIANQIAGTKAIFNFKRYDEEKPGIISTLGPMLDDVFAGLVAGCMSKIFEE